MTVATTAITRTDAFTAIVAQLGDELDLLVDRAARQFVRDLPSYSALQPAELAPLIRSNYEQLLEMLAAGRPPTSADAAGYRAAGEVRAAQGVSAGDMLQGWHVGLRTLRERAFELAADDPQRDAVLLELVDLALAWLDVAIVGSAAGHRQAELESLRTEQHRRANLVRSLLRGETATAELHTTAEALGLDPASRFHALRARPTSAHGLRSIEAHLDLVDSRGPRNGLVALIDGDVCGFAARVPSRGAPIPIGIADPVALHELAGAYRQASRALETALALGTPGAFTLSELGLHPAVLADPDVGAGMMARYVAPLESQGTPGRVILETVERYLANDARLEVTAGELCVHANTVRYRIGRFEELTSCSLRRTDTLAEVWWALARRRLRG